jgi:hypothetical protein
MSWRDAGFKLIAAPGVQKVQVITVSRLEHESGKDWQWLIGEVSETAGMMVECLKDGAVRIGWRQYCEARNKAEAWLILLAVKILIGWTFHRAAVVSRRDNNDMWGMAEKLSPSASAQNTSNFLSL